MLKEIDHAWDSPRDTMNKLIDAVQHLRGDCSIMYQSGKEYWMMDDDLKVVQAFAREFEDLFNKHKK